MSSSSYTDTTVRQITTAEPGWKAVYAFTEFAGDLKAATPEAILHCKPIAAWAVTVHQEMDDGGPVGNPFEFVQGLIIGPGHLMPALDSFADLELINLCGPDEDPFSHADWLSTARALIEDERFNRSEEGKAYWESVRNGEHPHDPRRQRLVLASGPLSRPSGLAAAVSP
jgi:hypothetical protein